MKKSIMLFVAMLIMQTGCITRTNLTSDPKFREVLAKQYQTQDDLVVFRYEDNKEGEYHLIEFDFQGIPSREEIKDVFPYQYESNTIYGVLHKGTHFKVIKVTLMRSFETSQTYYLAEILDGPFKGRQIDVSLLTGGGEVPQFLEKYAVPAGEGAGE